MSAANERQVGGQHYKTTYEHWDLVLKLGLGYFEGQATKYVARWRKKGGPSDLRKAVHFVDKLLENWKVVADQHAALSFTCTPYSAVEEMPKFAEANELAFQEAAICEILATWITPDDLRRARALIGELIDDDARPVPLEDSNKHAERAS